MGDIATLSAQDGSVQCADCAPYPLRFWWLKRIVFGSIAGLVFLVALRVWWGWDANRRVEATIAKYRAVGQSVLPEDFDLQIGVVRDGENGVVLLVEAIEQFGDGAGGQVEFEKAVSLIRQARKRSHAVWTGELLGRIPPRIPFVIKSYEDPLTDALWTAACEHYPRGKHAVALRYLLDYIFVCEVYALNRDRFDYFSFGLNRQDALLDYLRQENLLAVRLPSLTSSNDDGTAPVPLVKELISALLDDSRFIQAKVALVERKRLEGLNSRDTHYVVPPTGFTPGLPLVSPSVVVTRTLLGPKLDHKVEYQLRNYSQMIEAIEDRAWAQAKNCFAERPMKKTFLETTFNWLCWVLPWDELDNDLERGELDNLFVRLARRRLTAVALAIRVHQVVHNRNPKNLEELVPDYLPFVPVDPFASAGEPVRYKFDDTVPTLYSVGFDGDDDDGLPTIASGPNARSEDGDISFYVDRSWP